MASCLHCSTLNRTGARFCAVCGAPLVAAGAGPAVVAVPPCAACGHPNHAQARFCAGCGRPLCAACGHANRPAARYCQRCGRLLTRPPVPPLRPAQAGGLPAPGLIGSRYRILREVGRGGMGVVYLAEDTRTPGVQRALKELLIERAPPDERANLVDAFKREAHLLMTLAHPNLARGYDCFNDGGRDYLVMDYVDGKTLDEVANGRPLGEAPVLRFAFQLCDVLAYLHSRVPPIIYRDMKPQNAKLEAATGRVKLLDFGIARLHKPGKTKDTALLGTPGFAPPEQHGKGQTDARSDIFALGVTLYVLLTYYDVEQNPWRFPPIAERNSGVSPLLEKAIRKAVQLKMADRYQSVDELRAALRRCRGGREAEKEVANLGSGACH